MILNQRPSRHLARVGALVLTCLMLAACQSIIAVDVVHTTLSPPDSPENPILTLEQAQTITLDTGYERTLPRGSHWKLVGTIVEGRVYKPVDADFTIQGKDPVSAYLVISNGQLVGFFVPIEEGFSPLYKRVSISFAKPGKT